MSITEQGIAGEKETRELLIRSGCKDLAQIDWTAKNKADGKHYQFETKNKERYIAPPFDGHGLEAYQCQRRLALYKTTGMRPLFIVNERDATFYQWLDLLAENTNFLTRNLILIFPIHFFRVTPRFTGVIDWEFLETQGTIIDFTAHEFIKENL